MTLIKLPTSGDPLASAFFSKSYHAQPQLSSLDFLVLIWLHLPAWGPGGPSCLPWLSSVSTVGAWSLARDWYSRPEKSLIRWVWEPRSPSNRVQCLVGHPSHCSQHFIFTSHNYLNDHVKWNSPLFTDPEAGTSKWGTWAHTTQDQLGGATSLTLCLSSVEGASVST